MEFAFDLDHAAHHFHERLGNGQAKAGASVLDMGRGGNLLEFFKDGMNLGA